MIYLFNAGIFRFGKNSQRGLCSFTCKSRASILHLSFSFRRICARRSRNRFELCFGLGTALAASETSGRPCAASPLPAEFLGDEDEADDPAAVRLMRWRCGSRGSVHVRRDVVLTAFDLVLEDSVVGFSAFVLIVPSRRHLLRQALLLL